jgi:hypothetical protein
LQLSRSSRHSFNRLPRSTGHIAYRQLTTSGEAGRDLAYAGLILGYVFAVVQILLLVGFCVLYFLSTVHPPR